MKVKVFLIPNNYDELAFKMLLEDDIVINHRNTDRKKLPYYTLVCDMSPTPSLMHNYRSIKADWKFTLLDSTHIASMQLIPQEALIEYLLCL